MKIDEQLISRLENLARLELSPEEKKQIQSDLNNILEMVEKLQEVDTSNVEPLIYVSETQNVLRKDEIANQVTAKEALSNAPAANDEYFKVPKVIDL